MPRTEVHGDTRRVACLARAKLSNRSSLESSVGLFSQGQAFQPKFSWIVCRPIACAFGLVKLPRPLERPTASKVVSRQDKTDKIAC